MASCIERGCVFPAETDEGLCRYHAAMFSLEDSLVDSALDSQRELGNWFQVRVRGTYRRHGLIAAHRCAACGGNLDTDLTCCSACLAQDRFNKIRRYRFRRECGLCVRCGANNCVKSLCGSCSEKNKLRRENRGQIRLCARCEKPIDRRGRLCTDCINGSNNASRAKFVSRHEKRVTLVAPKLLDLVGFARVAFNRSDLTRESRRVTGLCIKCGKVRDRDGSLCTSCLARQANFLKSIFKSRQTAGLCITCGQRRPRPGRFKCVDCCRYSAALSVARSERNRAVGLCSCGNLRAAGRRTCQKCISIRKSNRQRFRGQGLCFSCGKRRPESGRAQCEQCLERCRVNKKRYRSRHPGRTEEGKKRLRQHRISQGLCSECGGHRDDSSKARCSKCRQKDLGVQARKRAKRRLALGKKVKERKTVDAATISALRASGASWRAISEETGVSVSTALRRIKTTRS
jgi:hypothetical protein